MTFFAASTIELMFFCFILFLYHLSFVLKRKDSVTYNYTFNFYINNVNIFTDTPSWMREPPIFEVHEDDFQEETISETAVIRNTRPDSQVDAPISKANESISPKAPCMTFDTPPAAGWSDSSSSVVNKPEPKPLAPDCGSNAASSTEANFAPTEVPSLQVPVMPSNAVRVSPGEPQSRASDSMFNLFHATETFSLLTSPAPSSQISVPITTKGASSDAWSTLTNHVKPEVSSYIRSRMRSIVNKTAPTSTLTTSASCVPTKSSAFIPFENSNARVSYKVTASIPSVPNDVPPQVPTAIPKAFSAIASPIKAEAETDPSVPHTCNNNFSSLHAPSEIAKVADHAKPVVSSYMRSRMRSILNKATSTSTLTTDASQPMPRFLTKADLIEMSNASNQDATISDKHNRTEMSTSPPPPPPPLSAPTFKPSIYKKKLSAPLLVSQSIEASSYWPMSTTSSIWSVDACYPANKLDPGFERSLTPPPPAPSIIPSNHYVSMPFYSYFPENNKWAFDFSTYPVRSRPQTPPHKIYEPNSGVSIFAHNIADDENTAPIRSTLSVIPACSTWRNREHVTFELAPFSQMPLSMRTYLSLFPDEHLPFPCFPIFYFLLRSRYFLSRKYPSLFPPLSTTSSSTSSSSSDSSSSPSSVTSSLCSTSSSLSVIHECSTPSSPASSESSTSTSSTSLPSLRLWPNTCNSRSASPRVPAASNTHLCRSLYCYFFRVLYPEEDLPDHDA